MSDRPTILQGNGESILNKLIILLMMIFTGTLKAQDAEVSEDEIMARVEKALTMEFSGFISEMQEINKLSLNYIEKKRDECSGEFSSLVINEKGEKVLKKKKLSKKEKRQCLFLLVNFRIRFTKMAYKARNIYLKKLQESQVEELRVMENNTLAKLKKLAKKYKK